MRITFGSFKGKKIYYSEKEINSGRVRPTSETTKSVVFNLILHSHHLKCKPIEDANVYDMFCGFGSIGFEFLSLGAKSCAFIDINTKCISNIQKTASKIEFNKSIKTYIQELPSMSGLKFNKNNILDFIYIDPPYLDNSLRISLGIIDQMIKKANISNDSLFIIEIPKEAARSTFLEKKVFNKSNIDVHLIKQVSSKTTIMFIKKKNKD